MKNDQKFFIVPGSPKEFIAAERLEAIKNAFPEAHCAIKCTTAEFSAVCPKSGMPDIYTLQIEYVPDQFIVELKSLKMYLHCFRLIGMFVENIANKIADDFYEIVKPEFLKISITQAVRGGILTEVETHRGSYGDNPPPKKSDKFETMDSE